MQKSLGRLPRSPTWTCFSPSKKVLLNPSSVMRRSVGCRAWFSRLSGRIRRLARLPRHLSQQSLARGAAAGTTSAVRAAGPERRLCFRECSGCWCCRPRSAPRSTNVPRWRHGAQRLAIDLEGHDPRRRRYTDRHFAAAEACLARCAAPPVRHRPARPGCAGACAEMGRPVCVRAQAASAKEPSRAASWSIRHRAGNRQG